MASASVRYRTSGGYTVTTVSTADRGAWYAVTGPHGFQVVLDQWDPPHSRPIRSTAELFAVLAREGQDPATLREIPRPNPIGSHPREDHPT